MFDWIVANALTIVVTVALVLVVGLIIYKMIKDKRSGKSSCGCGCGCGCDTCDKDNDGKN